MVETFGNAPVTKVRELSPAELQRMKQNMAKVPKIQQKAAEQQHKDNQDAERVIKVADHVDDPAEKEVVHDEVVTNTMSRWQRFVTSIRHVFSA